MTAEDAFLTLKKFFETNPACKTALRHLAEKVEVGVIIGDAVSCALFQVGEQPVLENRPAVSPDVVFHIKPESIYTIVANTEESTGVGDLGILILKECLAGNVRISIPGRILNVLTRGYLQILAAGGTKVMTFLAKYGLGNIATISKKIREMKKTSGN